MIFSRDSSHKAMHLQSLAIVVLVSMQCVKAAVPTYEPNGLELSQTEKDWALAKHNEYRRQEGASDMVELTWSTYLEERAKKHALKCKQVHSTDMEADKGRDEDGRRIGDLGENLSFDPIFEGLKRNGEWFSVVRGYPFNETIEKWHNEKKDRNYSYDPYWTSKCFCKKGASGCGHYEQIVWAYTYELGCARAVCNNKPGAANKQWTFDVCQYRPAGLYPTFAPHTKGTACCECGHRYHTENQIDNLSNDKFPRREWCCDGLCSLNEDCPGAVNASLIKCKDEDKYKKSKDTNVCVVQEREEKKKKEEEKKKKEEEERKKKKEEEDKKKKGSKASKASSALWVILTLVAILFGLI